MAAATRTYVSAASTKTLEGRGLSREQAHTAPQQSRAVQVSGEQGDGVREEQRDLYARMTWWKAMSRNDMSSQLNARMQYTDQSAQDSVKSAQMQKETGQCL